MTTYSAKPADGSVWVTGASSGIGRALALKLAREGFTVHATARSEDALAELERDVKDLAGTIIAAPGDVTDASAMADIAARIDADGAGLALAVFNAGIYLPVYGERTLKVQ